MMDWAEELKMTIRKTTARKGRRSKSRDVLNEAGGSSSAASTQKLNKDISIDITLDIHNESSSPTTTPTTYNNEFDSNRPPIRRVSGGWADTGLKGLKSKKNSFDDERFQVTKSATSTIPTDDIPIIPDLDDVRDDFMLNEIADPPPVRYSHEVALKELSSDLLSQNAFSAIEDVDLSMLTRCLHDQESLDEPDELWEWDRLFTEVTAQINSDKTLKAGVPEKLEIGPDVLPPTVKYD
ncbi:intraflagellar transport protein 43 homolog [Drosophila novamexicana]|uniref:intraflagellar transport protein 43 homolog n=1 Tax=Drosophila novamexicana TaxID=47314 RepID=UPI0011E5D083|nr:intraflagellar transport protein 43 homolog [Drosophila novamexicana]